jgi:hypothetical protein
MIQPLLVLHWALGSVTATTGLRIPQQPRPLLAPRRSPTANRVGVSASSCQQDLGPLGPQVLVAASRGRAGGGNRGHARPAAGVLRI